MNAISRETGCIFLCPFYLFLIKIPLRCTNIKIMRNKFQFQKELMSTVAWQILPTYARQAKNMILANKQNGLSLEELTEDVAPERTQFFLSRKAGSNSKFEELVVTDDAAWENRHGYIDPSDEVINVVVVDGAITRNGGACSVGSKQHCEMLIEASKMPNCIGHIFILNSPGGAASAAYDYERGINAVHEAGQPCIGLIDGICASACTRLSAKLDEVYYVHPQMEVGCIGTMALFYTNKDGDENETTHEVYHEIYADASTQKNGMFRKCAEGDDSEIKENLNKENDRFLSEMRQYRPNANEEVLSGPMYSCKDMEGILVHGQSDFDGCVNRILELTSKNASSQQPPQTNEPSSDGSHNTNTNVNMELKYQSIKAVIGEQENVTEEGFFLNDVNAQLLDDKLAEAQKSLDDAQQSVADLTSQLEAANAKVTELSAQVDEKSTALTEAENKVAALTASAEETSKANEEAIANLTAQHESEVSELNTVIENKDKEIEELSHAVTSQATPAPSTAAEGEGDGEKSEKKFIANLSELGLSRKEEIERFQSRGLKLGSI